MWKSFIFLMNNPNCFPFCYAFILCATHKKSIHYERYILMSFSRSLGDTFRFLFFLSLSFSFLWRKSFHIEFIITCCRFMFTYGDWLYGKNCFWIFPLSEKRLHDTWSKVFSFISTKWIMSQQNMWFSSSEQGGTFCERDLFVIA